MIIIIISKPSYLRMALDFSRAICFNKYIENNSLINMQNFIPEEEIRRD